MSLSSVLFKKELKLVVQEPDFFGDLNLTQIIDAIIKDKENYNLKPYFFTPLPGREDILYRQEVMKDMENTVLLEYIQTFSDQMLAMHQKLDEAKGSSYKYEKERLFLDAVDIYCKAIISLELNLSILNLSSEGFKSFHSYLKYYIQSGYFVLLLQETRKLLDDLSRLRYSVTIKELRVQLLLYKSEPDYSIDVERTFEKFKQEATKDYRLQFPPYPMNHIEAAILEGVASLYPEIFERLVNYYSKNTNYLDETISIFDREIQFYVSYQEYISQVKRRDLQFCYPEISIDQKDIYNYKGFDLALAYILARENATVVCNDFYLKEGERVFLVSGPNQGGKTTFARAFGQLHYLSAIGCPVPGSSAKLFHFDSIFTHFERSEDIHNLRSKLEDDLIRIHQILEQATPRSIIIMNEILSSTTLQDAILLSKKIMEKVISLNALCVWVSFIDELQEINKTIVSMISTIVPENPGLRTFKIERKRADGLAYALSIAEKYKVTYDSLKQRIPS